MTTKHTPDGKNPWLGFQTYQEIDARRFKGRSKDIKDLYNLVKDNPIVVCYADSGIGKSSLINAGLCPLLKKEQLFPIKIEVAEDCLSFDDFSLDEKIINRIEASIYTFNQDKDNKESKVTIIVEKDPSLDDPFLKMMDNAINSFIIDEKNNASPLWAEKETSETPITNTSVDKSTKCVSSLWWYLHTKVFFINISGLRIRLTPFLVFDQFEEIFYKAKSLKQVELFFRRFREISMNTPTAEVLQVYDDIDKDSHIEQKVDFPNANPLKSLFSLRREYIANLDYWTSQKMTFPSFQANKYCLMPLNKEQAIEVITGQNTDKLNILSDTIIQGLDQEEEAIPSILLSVICHELYDTDPLPESIDFENIILNAYNKVLEVKEEIDDKEIFIVKPGTVEILEERLTDSRGRRQQVTLEESGLLKHEYDYLIKNHVIKETANGEKIELVHDKLAEVIRGKVQSRQSQREDGKRHQKNLRYNIAQRKKMENVLTIAGREFLSNYSNFGNVDDDRQPLMSSITQFRFDYGERKRNSQTDFTSLSQLLDDTNSKYNHVCISFSDNKGHRCPSLDGIFEIEATFEKMNIRVDDTTEEIEMNLITQVVFYDESHSLLLNRYGFCGIKLSYDDKGNEIERAYLGKDFKLTNTTKCYSVVRRDYNEVGLVAAVKYFDKSMNSCNSYDGNHGYNSYYNIDGQEILRTFFDKNGNNICIRNGIYGQMFDYEDPKGQISVITNVDIQHKPCCDIKGYDRVLYHYDSKGRVNRITFCDENGNPVDKECGYAISTYGYDDLGQVSSVRFYNSKMIPAVSMEDGIFGMIFEYNFFGQPVVTQCIDRFGNPMLNKKGFAFISRQFDSIGLEVSSKYLDIRRQPTYGADNIHQTLIAYNQDSKLISEVSFLDEKGNLTQCKDGWARQQLYWDDEGREIVKYILYDETSPNPIVTGEKKFQSGNAYICSEIIRGELYEAKYIMDNSHRDVYYEPINNSIDDTIHHYYYQYDNVGRRYKELYFTAEDKSCTDQNGNYGIETLFDLENKEIGIAVLDKDGNRCKNDNGVSVTIKKKVSNGIWEEYYDVDGKTPVANLATHSHMTLIIDDTVYVTRDVNGNLCDSSWGYAYIKEWQDNDKPNVSFFAFYDSDNQPVLVNGWHKRKIVRTKEGETLSYYDKDNDLVSPYGFAERKTISDTGLDVVNQIISFTDEKGNPCDVQDTLNDEDIIASKWFFRGEGNKRHVFYAYNSRGKRVKGLFFYPYMKYLFWLSIPILLVLFLVYEYLVKPCLSILYIGNYKKKIAVPQLSESIGKPFRLFRKKIDIHYVPVIIVEEIFDQVPDIDGISENDYVKSASSIKGIRPNDILLEYGQWKYDVTNPNTIAEGMNCIEEGKKDSKSISVAFARIVESDKNENKSGENGFFQKILAFIKPEKKEYQQKVIRFRVSGNRLGVKFDKKDGLYNNHSVSMLIDYANEVKEEELKEVKKGILYTSVENIIQQSNVYRNVGFVYREDGLYSEAIDNYTKAILLMKSLPKYRKLDISQLYFELSYCYYCIEDFDKAIKEILEALFAVREIEEGWYISSQYKKILMQYYLANNHFEEAKIACGKYLEHIENKVSIDVYADAIDDMAYVLTKTEEWDISKEYEESAIQLLEGNGILSIELAQYYLRYSTILEALNDIQSSVLYKEKAIEIYGKLDLSKEQSIAWHELSVLYAKQELYHDAEDSIRKALSLIDDDSQESELYKELLSQYLISQNKFEEIIFIASSEGEIKLPIDLKEDTPFIILAWGEWNIAQNESPLSVIDNQKDCKKKAIIYMGNVVEFDTYINIDELHPQSLYVESNTKKRFVDCYLDWLKNKKK